MNKGVLVVDDEESILMVARSVLTDEGYDVRTARDGRDALSVLDEWQPAVILLDLMMPGMSAPAFLEEWRRRQSNEIPVVILSASRDAQAQAVALRASGALAKPFQIEDLVDAVAGFAGAHAP